MSIKLSTPRKIELSFLVLLATIFIALPIVVYFSSQQNLNLTDLRSKASGGDNPYFQCLTKTNDCAPGSTCSCVGGPSCTSTRCFPNDSSNTRCVNNGGILCPSNMGKNTFTCCTNGRTCYPNGRPGCKP